MLLGKRSAPLVAALCFVSLLVGSSRALAQTYDQFFTFGDSLADNGNVWLTSKLLRVSPAPPPSESPNKTYFDGRFSNGPVAFEYLWNQLRAGTNVGPLRPYLMSPIVPAKGGVNYAFGGTGTPLLFTTPGGLPAPGLLGQVELFRLGLVGRKPSKKALYAIVTGANDYREDQYNTPSDPTVVINNIVTAIRRLHAIGARDILVLSLPNLGCLPYPAPGVTCDESGQLPTGPNPTPSQLSAYHNFLLGQALSGLSLPGARIRFIDVNPPFSQLRAAIPNPPGYAGPFPFWSIPAIDLMLPPLPITDPNSGLPVPASACLFVNPALCSDVPPPALGPNVTVPPGLFWDVVHPTTGAHKVLAAYLLDRLPR
ncbi:MAG TPA: SGNH/GDSL hydrolase family protein [Luteitalea sp.]|nr:SGNH/GDSL hydrolase family protein [Luteitalea sp.]